MGANDRDGTDVHTGDDAMTVERPTATSRQSIDAHDERADAVDGGRYRVIERIGRGGMGEVLAARDLVLGREIAIKRLRAKSPSPSQVTRFLREARIQATLDHPAIPPVHELATDADGQPYFVMKRLLGTTLAEILSSVEKGDANAIQRFPRERLLRAFAEVCLAVELAHTRGVIHRDVKPSNIMLGEFGEIFVLDWGVAKVVDPLDENLAELRGSTPEVGETRAGTMIGTPGYMAPEQRIALPDLDGRADVYSLGCVLRDILAVAGQARDGGAHTGSVPPELDKLCNAATAANRETRLATARELGERVQRYLDGDRDLALRQQLAAEHLERARASLSRDDDTQRVAMQEAGRALALDPKLPGAAELVGRLMLEPTAVTVPDVEASLESARARSSAEHAIVGVMGYLALLGFVPFMLWSGLRSPMYLVAFVALLGCLIAIALYGARHQTSGLKLTPRGVLAIAGNAALVGLLARMYSPVVIAPGVAALIAGFLSSNPTLCAPRVVRVTVVVFSLAILAPWFAELLGFIEPTVIFTGDTMRIVPAAVEIDRVAMSVGLLVFAPSLVIVAGLLLAQRANAEAAVQRRLHLQAWRLRQLLPESGDAPLRI
jgi:eukaryotic-like serine/threonine-protein kinase